MENLLTITYKSQVFSLEELVSDNNEFAKKLVSFKPNRIDQDLLSSVDIGYFIANMKLDQLYELFTNAKFALINAHKKLHKSPIEWKSGYYGQLWLRVQYIKNAIIWYNSCIDYVYQVIWFAFDFSERLETKEDYEKELFKCNFDHSKLKSINFINDESASNFKELRSIINKTNGEVSVRKIREWANCLKHRANLYFNEIKEEEYLVVQFSDTLSSSDLYGGVLDLDETCQIVQDAHIKINDLIKQVIAFINFDGVYTFDEQGEILIGQRDKKLFKKILVDPSTVNIKK